MRVRGQTRLRKYAALHSGKVIDCNPLIHSAYAAPRSALLLVMEPSSTLTEQEDVEMCSESPQPITKPGMAEDHELYAQYLLMVGPQQGLRIYQVCENIRVQCITLHLTYMQKSTRKLMVSAEILASSCSRLFSRDGEQRALSEQEQEMGKKLEDLKKWFNSTLPDLLR